MFYILYDLSLFRNLNLENGFTKSCFGCLTKQSCLDLYLHCMRVSEPVVFDVFQDQIWFYVF